MYGFQYYMALNETMSLYVLNPIISGREGDGFVIRLFFFYSFRFQQITTTIKKETHKYVSVQVV